MIKVGITVAPRRQTYLSGLFNSLPLTLMDYTIFAEPGSIETDKEKTITHKKKRGCFNNWDFALRYLLKSDADYLCILQDDITFRHHYIINSIDFNNNAGFYSLYTPRFYKEKCKSIGWNNFNNGWNSVGACALIFPRKSAQMLVEDYQYLNHLFYGNNQQIDAIVCDVFKRLNLPTYYHNPSLSIHVGDVSSIGHKPMPKITNPL